MDFMAVVFYWTLNMSIEATFVGLIVLAIDRITSIPKQTHIILWFATFFRMAIPIGLKTNFSICHIIEQFIETKSITVLSNDSILTFSASNNLKFAGSYFPFVFRTSSIKRIFIFLSIIWLFILFLLTIYWMILYCLGIQVKKNAIPYIDNIFISNKIDSPTVYGILNPIIIIPYKYDVETLSHIKRHENNHIKRRDNLHRIIAIIISSIHWFNPFSWLFLKKYLEDIEFACDEKTIAQYSDQQKKDYARTLIMFAENKNISPAMYFAGGCLKKRITMILSYKKIKKWLSIVWAIIIISITINLMCN